MAIYTAAQLAAIISARAQGVREVYYGDKRVVYRSLDEMDKIIRDMQADLGIKKDVRRTFASHTKGLK